MNWLQAIGWIGAALLIWSVLQTRIMWLRILNLLAAIMLVGYNAALGIWPMVVLNIILGLINIFYLPRLITAAHKPPVYTIVEVEHDDKVLDHLLRTHAEAIDQTHATFTRTTTAIAFIIWRADNLAGLLLGHDAGDGDLQLDLDFIDPDFRNESKPGQFIQQQRGALAEKGFRRVLTPPAAKAQYDSKLGFVRTGDRFALQLSS